MSARKLFSGYLILLNLLLTWEAFSQEYVNQDSLLQTTIPQVITKPRIHYSAGTSFMFIPRYGSVSGINGSAFYLYPFTPRFSVEGGLIAGRYYSALKNRYPENKIYNSFNTLSVYGTAAYKLSERLTVYGTGIKKLAGQMPLYNMPSSSFTFGSTLNFGNFSVGASIQMSDWNNYYSPSRYIGNPDYLQSFPW